MKRTHRKINSKRIIDLNVRVKTVRLLEANIGVYLRDLVLCNDVLDTTPEAQVTKVKNG